MRMRGLDFLCLCLNYARLLKQSAFLKKEGAAVSIEAIWVGLFLAFLLAPTAYLFQISDTQLAAFWAQRTFARNEAISGNCAPGAFSLSPVNVRRGVNSITTVECDTGLDGETDLAADEHFWKRMESTGDRHFANFTRDMEDYGTIEVIRGHSSVLTTKELELGEADASSGPMTVESELLVPSTDYWIFEEAHWKEGHDQVICDALNSRSRKLFPNVYPSADGCSQNGGGSSGAAPPETIAALTPVLKNSTAGQTGATGGSGGSGQTGATSGSGGSGQTGATSGSGGSGQTGATSGSGTAGQTGATSGSGTAGQTGATGGSGGSGQTGTTSGSGGSGQTGATSGSGGSGQTGTTSGSGTAGQTGTTGGSGGAFTKAEPTELTSLASASSVCDPSSPEGMQARQIFSDFEGNLDELQKIADNVDYAAMAASVYEGSAYLDPEGWERIALPGGRSNTLSNAIGGDLRVQLFKNPDGDLVLSYAGTDDLGDALYDDPDSLDYMLYGILTPQMRQGVEYAQAVQAAYPDANLTFVGHSWGGAMADAARRSTGNDAVIYNAAPTNISRLTPSESHSGREGRLTAFKTPNDVLTSGLDEYVGGTIINPRSRLKDNEYSEGMESIARIRDLNIKQANDALRAESATKTAIISAVSNVYSGISALGRLPAIVVDYAVVTTVQSVVNYVPPEDAFTGLRGDIDVSNVKIESAFDAHSMAPLAAGMQDVGGALSYIQKCLSGGGAAPLVADNLNRMPISPVVLPLTHAGSTLPIANVDFPPLSRAGLPTPSTAPALPVSFSTQPLTQAGSTAPSALLDLPPLSGDYVPKIPPVIETPECPTFGSYVKAAGVNSLPEIGIFEKVKTNSREIEKRNKEWHYKRNDNPDQIYYENFDDFKAGEAKDRFVVVQYGVAESILHGEFNTKWYSSRGKGAEYVFKPDGTLETDPRYMGTFNYDTDGGGGHFGCDVVPWLFGGNTIDDPSTVASRSYQFFLVGGKAVADRFISDSLQTANEVGAAVVDTAVDAAIVVGDTAVDAAIVVGDAAVDAAIVVGDAAIVVGDAAVNAVVVAGGKIQEVGGAAVDKAKDALGAAGSWTKNKLGSGKIADFFGR